MDFITEQLAYALHDTIGYRDSEELDAKDIRSQLERNDIHLIRGTELDAYYQQGRKDEREFPSDLEV